MTTSHDPAAGVTAELMAECGNAVPPQQIRAAVYSAVADLQESVSSQALPEMAVRLARVRLGMTDRDGSVTAAGTTPAEEAGAPSPDRRCGP